MLQFIIGFVNGLENYRLLWEKKSISDLGLIIEIKGYLGSVLRFSENTV